MIQMFDNGVVRLFAGDVREVLRELPAESVQTCITSPPYWGLRSYGHWNMQTIWGTWNHFPPSRRYRDCHSFWLLWRAAERGGLTCRFGCCWIGSLGLEPTIDLYVEHMVEVFREVKRVLRDDGTLWLNMGDSYAGSWGAQSRANGNDIGSRLEGGSMLSARQIEAHPRGTTDVGSLKHTLGLKPKDLCGIPWRVAFALQANGWWLRSDIVWSKPNPMPESVTDRPTRAHEYVFLLSKSARYYYDAEAIRESSVDAIGVSRGGSLSRFGPSEKLVSANAHRGDSEYSSNGTRNKRTVWEIATEPYPDAHFATFPQKLVEPCILAGTPARGLCSKCGAPWERVVETERVKDPNRHTGRAAVGNSDRQDADEPRRLLMSTTTGWRPTCDHDAEPSPSLVLDPFIGSGTTAFVAQRLGRRAIGIDLSTDYLRLAEKRLRGQTLPMALNT